VPGTMAHTYNPSREAEIRRIVVEASSEPIAEHSGTRLSSHLGRRLRSGGL
jgi:hypothetical protein